MYGAPRRLNHFTIRRIFNAHGLPVLNQTRRLIVREVQDVAPALRAAVRENAMGRKPDFH